MRYFIKCTIGTLAVILLISVTTAQQATVSAGGDINGPGGSISHSAGQTDFNWHQTEHWSIQFGVQQAVPVEKIEIGTAYTEGGSIIGAGYYPVNAHVILTAQADPGYFFVKWVGNFSEVIPDKSYSESVHNPIEIIVKADTSISAVFQQVDSVVLPVASWALFLAAGLIFIFTLLRYYHPYFSL